MHLLKKQEGYNDLVDKWTQDNCNTCFILMVQVFIYTILFIMTIRKYGSILKGAMRNVLIAFEVLLITQLIFYCIMTFYFVKKKDFFDDAIDSTIKLYDYINRTVFVIIFYKVLFTLKRVEFQISPKYNSIDMVLTALKKLIKIERYMMTSFVLVDLTYITLQAIRVHDVLTEHVNGAVIHLLTLSLNLGIGMVVFSMNLYLIYYFYNMSTFFIDSLNQNNLINNRLSKFLVVFMTSNLIIYAFVENIFFSCLYVVDILIDMR